MGIHPRLSLPVPKHQNQLEVTAEYEDATGRKIEETFVVDFAAFENLSRVGEAPLHTIAKSIEKLQKSIGNLLTDRKRFRRVIRGLHTLLKGLRETGQDRLHQFVRSLEALTLPKIGSTKNQFAHRCQTFAGDTRALLLEAYEIRSDTEHLNPWDKAVENKYPPDKREDVCWQRTRQIEHLACDAYSRLLRDPALRKHFRTEDTIAAFWKLPDDQRRGLWGTPLDIAQEPFVQEYDQWGRASVN